MPVGSSLRWSSRQTPGSPEIPAVPPLPEYDRSWCSPPRHRIDGCEAVRNPVQNTFLRTGFFPLPWLHGLPAGTTASPAVRKNPRIPWHPVSEKHPWQQKTPHRCSAEVSQERSSPPGPNPERCRFPVSQGTYVRRRRGLHHTRLHTGQRKTPPPTAGEAHRLFSSP